MFTSPSHCGRLPSCMHRCSTATCTLCVCFAFLCFAIMFGALLLCCAAPGPWVSALHYTSGGVSGFPSTQGSFRLLQTHFAVVAQGDLFCWSSSCFSLVFPLLELVCNLSVPSVPSAMQGVSDALYVFVALEFFFPVSATVHVLMSVGRHAGAGWLCRPSQTFAAAMSGLHPSRPGCGDLSSTCL